MTSRIIRERFDMGERNLSQLIQTNRTPDEIRSAAIAAHRHLGGSIQMTGEGFIILHGKNNIGNSSFVNLAANVFIRKTADKTFEIQSYLNWNASNKTILFIFLFWPVSLMYFGFDPAPHYQFALNQIKLILEEKTQPRFRY
jgi:hypothetical protein